MSLSTRAIVMARAGGRCECGCGRRADEVHHIFARQRWAALIDEPDNCIAVARACHADHESAKRRFDRKLAHRAERLVSTGAMAAYLERMYR